MLTRNPKSRKWMAACLLFVPVTVSAQETVKEQSDTGITGSIEVVSDYRFRGVSLSNRKPALQGGVEYTHASGAFGGVWTSTIAENEGADQELDLFAGYSGIAGSLHYTVTALRYVYPGASGLGYTEVQANFDKPIGSFSTSLEVAYTPSQKNAVDNLYTSAGLSYEIPRAFLVSAKVGRENGAYDRKISWEAGIVRDFGPLSLRAEYVGTRRRTARLDKEARPTVMAGLSLNF